ncbi:hypothetical protein BH10PSE13_BH10PSE13_21030 [soil metagenome]
MLGPYSPAFPLLRGIPMPMARPSPFPTISASPPSADRAPPVHSGRETGPAGATLSCAGTAPGAGRCMALPAGARRNGGCAARLRDQPSETLCLPRHLTEFFPQSVSRVQAIPIQGAGLRTRESAMPLPLPQRPEQAPAHRAGTDHYFDAAHGDVASLHARIEQSLGQNGFVAAPHSQTADRIEHLVQGVSRSAGIVGLAGALALIGYALL